MSLEWQNRFQPLGKPAWTLRHMTREDLPGAAALSSRVKWINTEADWARALDLSPEGCFVIDEEGHGIVGTVTTIAYGTELGWIGRMIVDPDRQRRGAGQQLMRAALDHLIARDTQRIMLDATPTGRPLYERMGFRAVGKVEFWEGRASTFLGSRARRIQPGDVPALLELDAALFGVSRAEFLNQLLAHFPELGWVDWQRERLEGYLLGRAHADGGCYLGPWMATSTDGAERLLRAALEQLQGKQVRLNIPDDNPRAVVLVHNHNLSRKRHCTRMIYKDAQPIRREPLVEYAIGSLATG